MNNLSLHHSWEISSQYRREHTHSHITVTFLKTQCRKASQQKLNTAVLARDKKYFSNSRKTIHIVNRNNINMRKKKYHCWYQLIRFKRQKNTLWTQNSLEPRRVRDWSSLVLLSVLSTHECICSREFIRARLSRSFVSSIRFCYSKESSQGSAPTHEHLPQHTWAY